MKRQQEIAEYAAGDHKDSNEVWLYAKKIKFIKKMPEKMEEIAIGTQISQCIFKKENGKRDEEISNYWASIPKNQSFDGNFNEKIEISQIKELNNY